MTTILDFVKISKVDGVERYSLVSSKGKRLAGNHDEAETFYRELAHLGKDALTTRTSDAVPSLKAMTIHSRSRSLIVVPVGALILGVTPATESPESEVIEKIHHFLDRIRHQHTVSQKS